MAQQIIALVIILIFLLRLAQQKKKKQINGGEFSFWLIFWVISALAIIFLKEIDALVAKIGFGGSGINFLLYLAVVMLFYFIFRLRLRLAKQEREISALNRALTLKQGGQQE